MVADMPGDVNEYLALLSDRNPRVRRFALGRLAEIGTASVIPEVRRVAVDRDPMVAFQAGQTLKAILSRGVQVAPESYSPIGKSVGLPESSPLELRNMGLELLTPYMERLGQMISSASTSLARVAAASLGKLGDVRAAKYLAEGLKREDIAADCAVALSIMGDVSCLDLLLSLLDSRDDRLVQHAIFAVGVFKDERVTAGLERLLHHPAGHVRADAALVLGTLGAENVSEVVHSLLEDDDERVVMKALEVLSRLSPERFLEYLEVRLSSASERLRATMVALLVNVPEAEQTISILEKALDDKDARVRANAVEVVTSLKLLPEKVNKLLKPLRSDRNNRVLANLAVALAAVDIVASLEILSGLLGSTNKWERASAVFAAGFIAEEKVAMWLANIFVLEEDPDVLGNAVTSLSRCGGAEVADRMVQSLRHYNPRVRAGAARVLGMVARKGASRAHVRGALFSALEKEREISVVTAILQALPSLADASDIRALGPSLRHSSPQVQACAIDVLDAIGTIEILPYVEPFIFSPNSSVKAAATLAMWKQGHLDVIHVIGQMLESHDEEEEAESATFAFGEIGLTLYRLHDYQRCYLLAAALSARLLSSRNIEDEEQNSESTKESIGGPDEFFLQEGLQALNAAAAGDFEEAAESLRSLLSSHPDEPRIHYLLGRIYRRLDQRERALAHLQVAVPNYGDNVNLQLDMANLLHDMGDPPGALRAFMLAARARANLIEELSTMADDMLTGGLVQSASLTVKLIVESFANDVIIHGAVGEHLVDIGKFKEAISHLTKALIVEPGDREIRDLLAKALRRCGNEGLATQMGDDERETTDVP